MDDVTNVNVTVPSIEASILCTSNGTQANLTALTQINDSTGSLSIIEYRWDLGNGTIAYGPSLTYVYDALPIPFIVVTLRITDNRGHHWYAQLSDPLAL